MHVYSFNVCQQLGGRAHCILASYLGNLSIYCTASDVNLFSYVICSFFFFFREWFSYRENIVTITLDNISLSFSPSPFLSLPPILPSFLPFFPAVLRMNEILHLYLLIFSIPQYRLFSIISGFSFLLFELFLLVPL